MSTTFENKTRILSELWTQYRFEPTFTDFVEYNDIGLPLAFLISEDIVKSTSKGEAMVEETFALLLAVMGIEEDTGFENLDDLLVG
jgi:hypothetical protein